MAPSKDIIGITDEELRAVFEDYPFDGPGFRAALARRFTIEQLEKAYAYASYCNRSHGGSSLWSDHVMHFWDAANLARQQRSNPHAIDDWLAEYGRSVKEARQAKRTTPLIIAGVIGLVFFTVMSLIPVRWGVRIPATLAVVSVPMALMRTYTRSDLETSGILFLILIPIIFFFVVML